MFQVVKNVTPNYLTIRHVFYCESLKTELTSDGMLSLIHTSVLVILIR